MDKDLKEGFHKQFLNRMEELAKEAQKGNHTELDTAQWIFGFLPKFIEDVYEGGFEIGELSGRAKGHAVGVKEERERIKKLELKNANLN